MSDFDSLFADMEASLAADALVEDTLAAVDASVARQVPALCDPHSMPEEFAHSTMLALRAQQEILQLELYEDDPHYKAKLMAKASVAAQQISAQLRSDENALKSREVAISYYTEIKEALEKARERQRVNS